MAVLAILQPDARVEARLSEALAGTYVVLQHDDWPDLEVTLGDRSVDGCIVDGHHPDRDEAFRRLTAMRRRFPAMALVAFVESDQVERTVDLGFLGVDGVLMGSATATTMRADIDQALSVARARRVERDLADRLSEPGPAAVAWAVEHAGAETSVDRLAAGLNTTPAALRESLHAAGLPSPGRILLWGRMIQAGARIGDDGRKVEEVAFSLGYSTATAFGRAVKVHTGLTPAEIPAGAGLRSVLDALLRRYEAEEADSGGAGGGAFDRRAMCRIPALLGAVMMAGCASFGGPSVDRGAIEDVVDGPPIDQVHMGILAVDAETGRTLYSHNAHRKFVPASNQKILVTATALSLLGPDWRYRTEIRAAGERHGSVLDGDLEVVAVGDPSFSDRYWASGTEALEAMADSLRASGITYVAGSGVVNVAAWDSATVGPTWEVEDLRYTYGSTGGAFALDEGEILAVVSGGAALGDVATVRWEPRGTPDFVESRLETVAADSAVRVRPSYLPESRRLILDGTVPLGATDTVRFAQRDPVRQAVAAWTSAVERAGVVVEGGWSVRWTEEPDEGACPAADPAPGLGGTVEETDPCGASDGDDALLVSFASPPLSELIGGVLKPSQNWMTEQMVRTIGARYGSEGSWREGTGVIQAYLVNEVGVDSLDIVPRDGSGLSAYNLVTPRAIVRILTEMREGPFAAEFRAAMAEPGKEDSTLERRLLELEGRVFAKTGTISNVNSLSGYLVRDDGREVVFSVLTNGSGLPASRVRAAIDDVVRSLAR